MASLKVNRPSNFYWAMGSVIIVAVSYSSAGFFRRLFRQKREGGGRRCVVFVPVAELITNKTLLLNLSPPHWPATQAKATLYLIIYKFSPISAETLRDINGYRHTAVILDQHCYGR